MVSTNRETDSNDLKGILNLLVKKIDSYENKIDNIEDKVNELAVIKHQMDNFSKLFGEIQVDLRSLKTDFQELKNIEYRVEDLTKWKMQIDQILTISDLGKLKDKSYSQEILVTQLKDRLDTIKEEIKKETTGKNLVASGGIATLLIGAIQLIEYFLKNPSH